MPREPGLHGGGQHRDTVLVALTVPHDDLIRREVDVLDPEPRALEQAEASAVEQEAHQARHAVKSIENGPDLVPGQHNREPLRALRPDDVVEPRQILLQHRTIKEQQCAQRLILCRRRHLFLDGQVAQELRDLDRAHLRGMAFAVEEDVAADPGDIGLLGAPTVVPGPDGFSDPVEESRLRCGGRARFTDGQRPPEGASR